MWLVVVWIWGHIQAFNKYVVRPCDELGAVLDIGNAAVITQMNVPTLMGLTSSGDRH